MTYRLNEIYSHLIGDGLCDVGCDHGYCTIHCGKAHFGAKTTPGADPRTMGFEVNIAGGANGAPGSYLARKNFGPGTPQEQMSGDGKTGRPDVSV